MLCPRSPRRDGEWTIAPGLGATQQLVARGGLPRPQSAARGISQCYSAHAIAYVLSGVPLRSQPGLARLTEHARHEAARATWSSTSSRATIHARLPEPHRSVPHKVYLAPGCVCVPPRRMAKSAFSMKKRRSSDAYRAHTGEFLMHPLRVSVASRPCRR